MKTPNRPRLPSPLPVMTKKQFMVEYVLRRASTSTGPLNGDSAAKEAAYAWDVIKSRSAE